MVESFLFVNDRRSSSSSEVQVDEPPTQINSRLSYGEEEHG
jgi:hypothetical protein